MKQLTIFAITMLALAGIFGCNTQRKAVQKAVVTFTKYPEEGAKFCATYHPPKTKYIKGRPVVKTRVDTVHGEPVTMWVDCDSVVKANSAKSNVQKMHVGVNSYKVPVKCPPCDTVFVYVDSSTTDTALQVNTAAIDTLERALNATNKQLATEHGKYVNCRQMLGWLAVLVIGVVIWALMGKYVKNK